VTTYWDRNKPPNQPNIEKLQTLGPGVVTTTPAELQANDAADAGKSIDFLKSKGMQVDTLNAEQQKAFVAVAKELFPKFSGLVKDQVFFDKTLAAVGKK
jgi:hypothetical protein